MYTLLATLFAVWFIGSCIVFLANKIISRTFEEDSLSDKDLAIHAMKWPVVLIKLILNKVKS